MCGESQCTRLVLLCRISHEIWSFCWCFIQEEILQAKLENARKENESLRLMVEIMNDKCKLLQSQIHDTIIQTEEVKNNYLGLVGSSHNESEHNRRPKTVHVSKASKIYVKTHLDDNSLVSSPKSIYQNIINDWVLDRFLILVVMMLGSERWLSMEEIWTESYQGQSVAKSLFSLFHGSSLPCQEEGISWKGFTCQKKLSLPV